MHDGGLTKIKKQYWINKGFSLEESAIKVSEEQKRRSPRCIEYWINKGFSLEEAKEKISKAQAILSKKSVQTRSYWREKGKTEEQIDKILSDQVEHAPWATFKKGNDHSKNFNLEFYIKKYGEKLGKEKFENRIESCRYRGSIKYYIDKYGEKLGKEKYCKRYDCFGIYSKKSIECFNKLIKDIPELQNYKKYWKEKEFGNYDKINKKILFL